MATAISVRQLAVTFPARGRQAAVTVYFASDTPPEISDAMRTKAKTMRKKGSPVREIAAELGVSIPSVYNITKD